MKTAAILYNVLLRWDSKRNTVAQRLIRTHWIRNFLTDMLELMARIKIFVSVLESLP